MRRVQTARTHSTTTGRYPHGRLHHGPGSRLPYVFRSYRDTGSGECGTLRSATDNDLDEAPSDGLKLQQAQRLEVFLPHCTRYLRSHVSKGAVTPDAHQASIDEQSVSDERPLVSQAKLRVKQILKNAPASLLCGHLRRHLVESIEQSPT